MQLSQAVAHYGNKARVAKALGVSRSLVGRWEKDYAGKVPAKYAAQIHVDSRGKVPFDVKAYGTRD